MRVAPELDYRDQMHIIFLTGNIDSLFGPLTVVRFLTANSLWSSLWARPMWDPPTSIAVRSLFA